MSSDIAVVRELLQCSIAELATATDVGQATVERWLAGRVVPSTQKLELLYSYAYKRGIRLNQIKGQLHAEQQRAAGKIALFHGSKSGIEGSLSLSHTSRNNDFGRGFYCGESVNQSVGYVSRFPGGTLYAVGFNPLGLAAQRYVVDLDWMLTIAWFRGQLRDYAGHPRVRELIGRVRTADYVVAPIADNRMYQIINDFADGEITDVQCMHCLAATNLGNQYVLLTKQALAQAELVEHCFLCEAERSEAGKVQREATAIGVDKAKVARRQFRNQGSYVDQVLI